MTEIDWAAEERLPIRRMLTPADLVSLTNGLLGILAIFSLLAGSIPIAFSFILLAVIFDGADGALSRLGHGGGRLGGKLDTLSDLVSFVVAPSVLLWTGYSQIPWTTDPVSTLAQLTGKGLVLAASLLFFVTGVLRLARFDYLKGGERHDYFVGVTTPGAATVLSCLVLLGWDPLPTIALVAFVSLLMVSRVRLPKLRRTLGPLGAIVLLTGAVLQDAFDGFALILLLVSFLAYLVLGPGYVRRHHEPDETPFVT